MISIYIGRRDLASELHERLKKGIVGFTYRTKSGRVVKAIGTRNLNIARSIGFVIDDPKSGVHRPNCYYDLAKRGWRGYIPQNIIRIDG